MANPQPEKSALERHLHTFGLAVLIAYAGWSAKNQLETTTRIAVIEVVVKNLESSEADRYTASEARQVTGDLSRRIDRNEARIDRIEQRQERPRQQ